MFIREYKPYENVRLVFLIEFFTKILDQMFPIFMRGFYSKLHVKGLTLTTHVKGIVVIIDKKSLGSYLSYCSLEYTTHMMDHQSLRGST